MTNCRFGKMSDIARELGISRSAVSKAFKKHSIQRTADGVYNIDYTVWLLSEKQNQRRSEGQRLSRRKPAGVNNPRVRREVIRTIDHLWATAFEKTLAELLEGFGDDGRDEFFSQAITDALLTCKSVWENFHNAVDQEFGTDPADLPFSRPGLIEFNFLMGGDLIDHVEMYCEQYLGKKHDDMSLEEIKKLLSLLPDMDISDIDDELYQAEG